MSVLAWAPDILPEVVGHVEGGDSVPDMDWVGFTRRLDKTERVRTVSGWPTMRGEAFGASPKLQAWIYIHADDEIHAALPDHLNERNSGPEFRSVAGLHLRTLR